MTTRRKLTRGQIIATLAVGVPLAVACGIGAAVASNGSSTPTPTEPPGGYSAEVACEGFVKDQLKAPATAQFSGEAFTGKSPTFVVTGDVDAQNSFGALLRNHWTCTVKLDGQDWVLQSLTGIN